MRISHLSIKNFRCFNTLELDFNSPITLIEGLNGTGKTSLLEALHYLCYLRSFRTHIPNELVQFGQEHFFIKARLLKEHDEHNLQVGFSHRKRLVKIDEKAIGSYKELLNFYRIVTLTEDDLELIKGGPDQRRLFIDQAIVLENADFVQLSKRCKDIVDNRNALLKRGGSSDSYALWTQQLWQVSLHIQQARIAMLVHLEQAVKELIAAYFNNEFTISFNYQPKKALYGSFDEFINAQATLYQDEQRFGRSLFGAHLDDFGIHFKDIKSKSFASRGQQKLIILLLKVAQIRLLESQHRPAILLLDDFMTDFDHSRAQTLIAILCSLKIQLIFTVPTTEGFLQKELLARGASNLKLTI